ncbi:hypothetical protein [Gloeobacter kilaueensis]|uniref:HEAT repeat domain-containing protein n=1 Tax=Gloeobacter kilaueensis (strain ATCC BAA-2537 / CCAP 1431/1 / ULC 316 / JS1) TaxID=1183438 RepID=U5QM21_GLOK1|nr:hypothetical protein [Gloeobacter kilaueensis]AGY60032.1 hypothetical protein GKIL_3786 [Gloeobacter kilaueensis JS1]
MHMNFEDIYDEYERNGRISRASTAFLKLLIAGPDPFTAITVATDCAAFSTAPVIATTLDSTDVMVRWNAVGALLTRFRFAEYARAGLELAINDPDMMVRGIALVGLGEVLPDVIEPDLRYEMAKTLYETVMNAEEEPHMRMNAYFGILSAMDILPLDRPPASRVLPFEKMDHATINNFRALFLP